MSRLNILFALLIFFNSCIEKNKKSEVENKKELNNIKNDSTGFFLPEPYKNVVDNISIFLPENYTVLDSISGNLNLDNYNDFGFEKE